VKNIRFLGLNIDISEQELKLEIIWNCKIIIKFAKKTDFKFKIFVGQFVKKKRNQQHSVKFSFVFCCLIFRNVVDELNENEKKMLSHYYWFFFWISKNVYLFSDNKRWKDKKGQILGKSNSVERGGVAMPTLLR
jgi:hypothetical protein